MFPALGTKMTPESIFAKYCKMIKMCGGDFRVNSPLTLDWHKCNWHQPKASTMCCAWCCYTATLEGAHWTRSMLPVTAIVQETEKSKCCSLIVGGIAADSISFRMLLRQDQKLFCICCLWFCRSCSLRDSQVTVFALMSLARRATWLQRMIRSFVLGNSTNLPAVCTLCMLNAFCRPRITLT